MQLHGVQPGKKNAHGKEKRGSVTERTEPPAWKDERRICQSSRPFLQMSALHLATSSGEHPAEIHDLLLAR